MNILLVRLRLIGDVVFTTPAVRALRRARPGARLTYLVESAASPVVRGLRELDEVIVVPHTRGVQRLRDDVALGRTLRRQRFDVVFDFHGGPRGSWLTFATGAPVRVGYTIPGRSWMYTVRVPRSRALLPRHSVLNQWDLVRAAVPDVGDASPERDAVAMTEDDSAAANVLRRWPDLDATTGPQTIVVHVSAGNPFRRWPFESFVELVSGLSSGARNRRIILTSGPSEAEAAARIGEAARHRLGPAAGAMIEFGDLTLAELRAVVARASLYIGGDSGPLHVASTTGTPIVGLYGPTLAERSAPWRSRSLVTMSVDAGPLDCRPCDQRRCVHGDFRCLSRLPYEQVVAAAERALASPGRVHQFE